MTIYDVKLAGGESVICHSIDAESLRILDGLLEFWQDGKCIFWAGINRLISVRPR